MAEVDADSIYNEQHGGGGGGEIVVSRFLTVPK